MLKDVLFGGVSPAGWAPNVGLLIGRASIGLMLALGHGWDKIYQDGHFGPSQQLIDGLTHMKIPVPSVSAWCVALAEFAGGILMAVGLLTRPAAAVVAFNMGVAAFVAHHDAPLFMSGPDPSKESALLYFFPAVMLMLVGAGHFSGDRMITTLKTRASSSGAAN